MIPDKYVNDFFKSKCTNGKVLTVRRDQKSKSVFITDGVSQGNHWTLLAVDVKEKLSYYGDSLRWDVPSNLTHMVEPLLCNWEFNLNDVIMCCSWQTARYPNVYPNLHFIVITKFLFNNLPDPMLDISLIFL